MLRIFVLIYLPICIRKWELSSTGTFDPRKLYTNDVARFFAYYDLTLRKKEKINV